MKETVQQFIAKNHLFEKGRKALIGVSGGVDSVVLAHVLHYFNPDIALAHANFGLRKEASEKDEVFVRQLAEKLNVPFYRKQFKTLDYAKQKGISVQMAARKLRYFWFDSLAQTAGYDYIAVGTNLNDAIETFLFNATKGTGLSGLRGIKPVRGKIIRPLLEKTKAEIIAFAQSNEIAWREDASNQSNKYSRNLIRNEVIPLLKEINPSLESTFYRTMKGLSRTEAFMEDQMAHLTTSWIQERRYETEIQTLEWKTHPFRDVITQYLLKPFGFNVFQIAEISDALDGSPGKKFFSDDFVLLLDRHSVFILPKRFDIAPGVVKITEFLGAIESPVSLHIEDCHAHEITQYTPGHAYLDFDKLTFPLTLRKWQEGDRFVPLGMKGSKKISDFLIDQKIPLHRKENIWVLESDGDICWVVGHRIDHRFKLNQQTKRVYHLSLPDES